VLVTTNDVSTGYFETLRIPLLKGRDFNQFDREGKVRVAIVTKAMSDHFWPGIDALGKRFSFFGDPTFIQIVGIAANNTQFQIGERPQPVIYLPVEQVYSPVMTLHVRTIGDPDTVLAAVRSQVQSLNRSVALTNVQTIGAVFAQGLWAPRMGAVLLSLFGAIALILATVGIYGVIAYSVGQRTREIGVRIALGAQPRDVRRLIIGEGMLLAAAGSAIGIIVALLSGRLFSTLLYDISPSDPLTFAAVTILLTIVALLACYIPVQRALRIDPTAALRFE
jgi:putative ABC transport system permease protein